MHKAALFSDIHGNSAALRAVLADIEREKCAQAFMLGDLFNGFDPQGCVDLLRAWPTVSEVELACLRGNAEAYLLTPDLEALPRQDEDWNSDLILLIKWWLARLTPDSVDWLRSFPTYLDWDSACLVHDTPLDRFSTRWHKPGIALHHQEWFHHSAGITADMQDSEWQELLAFMDTRGTEQIFCGHSHIPFYREFGDRLVCNVGSAGAPLDGDPRPAWVLLEETGAGKPAISIRRVEYDLEPIYQIIDQAAEHPDFIIPGYRQAYKKWLATGIHWKAHL